MFIRLSLLIVLLISLISFLIFLLVYPIICLESCMYVFLFIVLSLSETMLLGVHIDN